MKEDFESSSPERRENFFTELLKFLVIACAIAVVVRFFVAEPFIVYGESMQPTFYTGQYLIVDEFSYKIEQPQRGDVIVFKYPKSEPNNPQYFIKRIIGLPGETVEVAPDSVTIVEHSGAKEILPEPYLTNRGNGGPQSVALNADQYFVMGDNRPNSSDSRAWGPVPRGNIVGRAIVRLLPISAASILPGKFSFPSVTSASAASAASTPAS